MMEIIDQVLQHPNFWLIFVLLLIVVVIVLAVFVHAYLSGRRMKFGPVEIGGKAKENVKQSALEQQGSIVETNLSEATLSPVPPLDIVSYDLQTEDGASKFYQQLIDSFRGTHGEVFVSGRGFSKPTRRERKHMEALLEATEDALRRGVSILRIQTSDRSTTEWAKRYSALMEKYPQQHRVYGDFFNPPMVNVSLFDPISERSEIFLLFESHEISIGDEEGNFDDDQAVPAVGVSIRNQRHLASHIRSQFLLRRKVLDPIGSVAVGELSAACYYFAYGSNVSSRQMRGRCPSATCLGVAYLYEWRLEFSVPAPHLGGAAAGIYRSEGDYVVGVVYALQERDLKKLNKVEEGGYRPTEVNVKVRRSQDHLNVRTYIPSKDRDVSLLPDQNYLQVMLEGAQENEIVELVDSLGKLVENAEGTKDL